MNLSDFQKLCDRLNPYCRHALEAAVYLCRERTHFTVTVDHFIAKLLEDPNCDIGLIARVYGVDVGEWTAAVQQSLDQQKSGNTGGVHWSQEVLQLVERGWMIASTHFGFAQVRSGTILLALLALREDSLSFRDSTATIAGSGEEAALTLIKRTELEENLEAFLKGSSEGAPGAAEHASAPKGTGETLARFTINLNEQARAGKLDRALGRDVEIRQVIDILCRRRKNNAILVGEPGVGKTAIAEGLALRIVANDVPDVLADVELLTLDLGLLQAGAGVKGEFENRLKQIIKEVADAPKPIVLFIDEAHLLIGAGAQAGSGDAANLLKPALARGALRSIAATTWAEYKKYFEKDAALSDRFEVVKIDEPSEELAAIMLRGTKDAYEKHHRIQILDDGLTAAVRLSNRYLTGRQLPRKAVDLLDTAAARVRVGLSAKPAVIDDLERRLQNLEIERKSRQRDQDTRVADHTARLAELDELITQTRSDLDTFTQRWDKEKQAVDKYQELRGKLHADAEGDGNGEPVELPAGERQALMDELEQALAELRETQGTNPLIPVHLDETIAARVIADWTGIPVGNMVEQELPKLINLEERLRERICGQDHALRELAETIRINKTGLGNPNAPIGVFLLVGPSGTGKTESALALADVLFGGERFMTSINMSEFKEEHTISLLIGSPPGYVGYGEGGVLTEAVRQRPYNVVLLDEVEKAHPQIMELFYQIFDKGYCEDRTGRYINFRNTIILMTSNLDSARITEMCGTEPRPEVSEIVEAIRPTLINHFKPALLARFRVIPFYALGPSVLRDIAKLKFDKVARRFRDTHGIALACADEVLDHVVDRCNVTDLGARQIDHLISQEILPPVSLELLKRMSTRQPPRGVELRLGESGQFEAVYS